MFIGSEEGTPGVRESGVHTRSAQASNVASPVVSPSEPMTGLVDAAPDLLTALVRLLQDIEDYGPFGIPPSEALLNAARAAIAKAQKTTGGSAPASEAYRLTKHRERT